MPAKGNITITEEKGLDTYARPKIAKPQKKKIGETMLENRIVVVSTYGPLNAFLESEIHGFDERFSVDLVDRAEINYPPYINVKERECQRAKPYLIIDFQKIIVNERKRVVDEEKRIGVRRIALSELIREYADSVEKGEVVGNDIYTKEDKPTEVRSKATAIAKGLIDMLDAKLHSFWEAADKKAFVIREILDRVEFDEYRKWAFLRKAYYARPANELIKNIEERVKYDSEGNFLSNSLDIKDLLPLLKENTLALIEKNIEKVKFFRIMGFGVEGDIKKEFYY